MIYVYGVGLLAAVAVLAVSLALLRRRYRRDVALSYFEGFRDGVRYEATANHASAPRNDADDTHFKRSLRVEAKLAEMIGQQKQKIGGSVKK